jgi:2-succinyl-5-enolpyruvyl-6-hydroxy-3-cyclohexene-1-carboxylate synthase
MTAHDGELGLGWAFALLDGLARSGVRRVVASPGSRSTPLTLAALRHPDLQAQIVVDERSAGFFALGLAKAERRPVALVATSGSAVANWSPAVVEADMAKIPLILLSADRPPELQDCGANQTMDQIGLFGRHVRAFHALPPPEEDVSWLADFAARVVAESLFPVAGPVHVNAPLREPLTPRGPTPPAAAGGPKFLRGRAGLDADQIQQVASSLRGRGIIFCGPEDLGDEFRAEVVVLARRLNIAIVADMLSGLRFDGRDDPHVLRFPDWIARAAPRFDWALRFGPAPVGKAVNSWLRANRQAAQIVVAADWRFADPDRIATHFLAADPAGLCRGLAAPPAPDEWRGGLLAHDRTARRHAEAICAAGPLFEGALLRALFMSLPDGAALFLANSLVIRSAEWFCGAGARKRACFGNRGLSGIDGNLSTACGLAASRGRVVAVLGDLALLHDANALLLARDLPLTILVMDNGGGGVFDHLPQTALPEFERGWRTPQSFDAAALARAFGLAYRRVESVADGVGAVAESLDQPGATLVHAVIDPRRSLSLCRKFFATSQEDA